MNIPEKVKIGFKTYEIKKINDDVIADSKVCYGSIQYNDGIVNISTLHSEDLQKCTLIHECIHGIDDIFDIGLEEEQVVQLGKGIYQFVIDNPGMFKD